MNEIEMSKDLELWMDNTIQGWIKSEYSISYLKNKKKYPSQSNKILNHGSRKILKYGLNLYSKPFIL